MAFPVSPTEGQTYTENNTVWIYSSTAQQWFRSQVNPENETLYKFGSASATGSAGEIQYTDGTNLAASPNLVWDNVNNELEVGGDIVLDDNIAGPTTTLQTITPTANRTISLPNATGTVALVAGSSGQITYNNAGANAGVSSFTADSSGRLTNSASSAASLPVKLWNGTIFAGTTPHVLVQPSTASAGSWSASGTALGVNTAAAFGGNLLDLQVNGTSQANFGAGGALSLNNGSLLFRPSVSGASEIRFLNNGMIFRGVSEGLVARFTSSLGDEGLNITSTGQISFASDSPTNNVGDTVLRRDAAGTLAQRNAANAQTFRVYNTFTNASNYERGKLEWLGNEFRIGTEAGSSGSVRSLGIYSGNVRYQIIGSNYNQFDKDVYLNSANIVTGGAGFKIGTATTQKIGFYNATPVVQPAAVADATDAASVITQLNALLSRMRDLGLIAT